MKANIFSPFDGTRCHPDEREIEEVELAHGGGWMNFRIRLKDGSEVWAKGNALQIQKLAEIANGKA